MPMFLVAYRYVRFTKDTDGAPEQTRLNPGLAHLARPRLPIRRGPSPAAAEGHVNRSLECQLDHLDFGAPEGKWSFPMPTGLSQHGDYFSPPAL